MNRRMVFGIGDSVVSSLATFLVGVYATRTLPLEDLGAYGLFFAGTVMLVSGFVAQLYFLPAEVALVELPVDEQVATLPRTAIRGVPLTVATSLVVGFAAAAILGFDVDPALAVTAIGTGAVWPVQDHVRRLLHQVGESGRALWISVAQILTTALVLVVGISIDAAPTAIPFTALVVANVASCSVGLWIGLDRQRRARSHAPDLRAVVGVGKWLVVAGQAEQIAAFVALGILSWIAGRAALGEYEAARLVAQPMIVLSFGLQNFLRGPAMTSVKNLDRPAGRRAANTYLWLLGAAAAGYAVVAGVEWPGNPLVELFPAAYGLTGMVALTILAAALMQSKGVYGLQALAGGKERDLARIAIPNAPVMPVTVALLAAPLGAYAVPLGTVADRVFWQMRFRPVFASLFAGKPSGDPEGQPR